MHYFLGMTASLQGTEFGKQKDVPRVGKDVPTRLPVVPETRPDDPYPCRDVPAARQGIPSRRAGVPKPRPDVPEGQKDVPEGQKDVPRSEYQFRSQAPQLPAECEKRFGRGISDRIYKMNRIDKNLNTRLQSHPENPDNPVE